MKTVLLTGTGSVANSWDPINRALQKVFPEASVGEANTVFATLVYNLRYYKKHGLEKRFDSLFDQYTQLQLAISEYLRRAQDKRHIWLRPEFYKLWNRFNIGRDEAPVVTTNWDTLLEDVACTRIYLHGNLAKPDSLYLPAEVSDETYRTPRLHEKRFESARLALREADRLVIYGLSLSPLDTELGILLSLATSGEAPLSEVFIVDEAPSTVAARVRWYIAQGNRKSVPDFLLLRPGDIPREPLFEARPPTRRAGGHSSP